MTRCDCYHVPMRLALIICVSLLASIALADRPTTGPADLRQQLRDRMDGNQVWGWDQAKRLIYNDVDWQADTVVCIYGGGPVRLQGERGQQRQVNNGGMSIEHSWPRNADWGDGVGEGTPEESDLHHLFPAKQGLNNARSNHRYGTPVVDVEPLRVRPNGHLARGSQPGAGTGSRRGKDAAGQSVFEPPAAKRGDVARALFYVSVRYDKAMPDDMEATLRRWHLADPPDAAERARNGRIADLQGNSNVFIEQPKLVGRIGDF